LLSLCIVKTRYILLFALVTLSIPRLFAQGIISTIAGTGKTGFHGDGGQADTCKFYNPFDVSFDTAGNIYISDGNNFRVRKIDKHTGIITTIAGNGIDTFSIDSVNAITTGMNPDGIYATAKGDVYIADVKNNRIRKVDAITGNITTVAGNGKQGYAGDTGLAIQDELYWPTDVCADTAGNIYIADYGNNRVRKVNATTGKISTIAGNGTAGFSGDGSMATSAELNAPTYVCSDKQGNIYISDVNNNVIRMIDAGTGKISTVAGNDTGGFSGDGMLAVHASLLSPAGIFVNNKGDLYIADENNDRIRRVAGGYITTVAGGSTATSIGDGNLSTNARLSSPTGVYVDTSGAIYISDMLNQRIRFVQKPNGVYNITHVNIITIYPNPSDGRFILETSTPPQSGAQIDIYNIAGNLVHHTQLTQTKEEINISAQPAGMYFIHILSGTNNYVEKLIISK